MANTPMNANTPRVQQGMLVFGSDNQQIGTIEAAQGTSIRVRGQQIPLSAIARVDAQQNRVFLSGTGAQYLAQAGAQAGTTRGQQTEGSISVPIVEERLDVEKRQVGMGEVEVRKTVVQEQQTVPVDLTREEVHVDQHTTAERPLTGEEAKTAFDSGTIRVPVRGEEAVVTKEAVVTGEVVIQKERVTEQQTVADTVRKQRVEVDENYQQTQSAPQQRASTPPAATPAGAPRAQAQPAATPAAMPRREPEAPSRKQVEVDEGMEVASSDGTILGMVKEVRASDFLLDRSMQRDLYVPFNAVAKAEGNRIVLNVAADDVGNMDWQMPGLL